jgi:hypothetical protein
MLRVVVLALSVHRVRFGIVTKGVVSMNKWG